MAANVGFQAWSDRYADLAIGKRNWQIAAASALAIAAILAGGMVWLSAHTRIVPYVVEVDHLGQAVSFPQPLAAGGGALTADMIKAELTAFVIDTRSVSSDQGVQNAWLANIHSRARNDADRFLNQYFHEDDYAHNPFKIGQKHTVEVRVDSILQQSDHSYQVRWTEQMRTEGVSDSPPTKWEALLTTALDAHGTPENPLGFHVTQIRWTEQGD